MTDLLVRNSKQLGLQRDVEAAIDRDKSTTLMHEARIMRYACSDGQCHTFITPDRHVE
jgi:hypothetical protein|tara:strand:- start:136 stop:309 length:174 start_codon:yes stop_codon:yes gene_type:complete